MNEIVRKNSAANCPICSKPTDVEHVKRVKATAGGAPVFVGSGVSVETIAEFLPFADGFIVGTAFKEGGLVGNPVDVQRVKAMMGVHPPRRCLI